MHYLTVQDILWINHEVTKQVNPFKFAQLEEATNYQYGYGKSEDILGQAGTFFEGFMKLRPFTTGNKGTAFVSVLAFLKMNGYDVNLEPDKAVGWASGVADRSVKGAAAIQSAVVPSDRPVELKPIIRTDVHDILNQYADTIAAIAD